MTPTFNDPHEQRRREQAKRAREKGTLQQAAAAARRLVPREDPRPGYWLVRVAKGGPLVAACLRIVETTAEPDNPDNDMTGTRSPHLGAFILDNPVAIDRVWHSRQGTITAAEYLYQCETAAWQRQYSPEEPLAQPHRKVDLTAVPIPFAEQS